MSEGIEDRLRRFEPRTASNLLLWGILLFILLFIIWASLTQIDRTVRGQGKVVSSSRLQVISNLEGGIVADILVQSGQDVTAGAPLIRLDGTLSTAEFGSSNAASSALAVKIARLRAEVAGRTPSYPPSDDGLVTIESALHDARMAELASLAAGARARITQAERALAEAQANYGARASAQRSAAAERDMIRPLVERGIEPQIALVQSQNAATITANEAVAASAAIARARATLAEAQAGLNQANQDWRARAATELATAQAELSTRTRTLPALSSRVDRTVIRAPVGGRVNRVLVTTVGGSVSPGQPLVELVPSREALQIEALVSPKDIGSVRIGQRAKVDITAYDPAVYGSLEGQVVTISPDAVLNERTGESHYVIRVSTNKAALTDRNGKRLAIGSGMVATVNLLGDKRSVMSYILTPITRLSETAFRE
jgi:membrane fusion protein, adhesin transport system